MDKAEFNSLGILEKFKLLKESATYIGARQHEGYFVHLFSLDGFFVEGWRRIGESGYIWIEVVNNEQSLAPYLNDINLKY